MLCTHENQKIGALCTWPSGQFREPLGTGAKAHWFKCIALALIQVISRTGGEYMLCCDVIITGEVDLSFFDISNDRVNLKAATMNRGEFFFECCPER